MPETDAGVRQPYRAREDGRGRMVGLMRNEGWRRPGWSPGRPDDRDGPGRLARMTVAQPGGDAGLPEAVLALPGRQAAAGRAPFAALVVAVTSARPGQGRR